MEKLTIIINNWLILMGITPNLEGYKYLKDGIILCFQNNSLINNLTKGLYPTIAKLYQKNSATIERNIRHAIKVSVESGKILFLNKIMGDLVISSSDKPTASQLIAILTERLYMQCI